MKRQVNLAGRLLMHGDFACHLAGKHPSQHIGTCSINKKLVWLGDGAYLISFSADSSSASRERTFSTALLKLTVMALN